MLGGRLGRKWIDCPQTFHVETGERLPRMSNGGGVVALVALLALLLLHILVLSFGFGVACAARRRPVATNWIIGAFVVAGFGAIWLGGETASANLRAGYGLVAAGLVLVFVGVPTWAAVRIVREPNRPVGWASWTNWLATYLAACWIFVILLGLPLAILVSLATAPPGSLR
jgi:hypothetical protein